MSEIRDPDEPIDPNIVTAECRACESLIGWDRRDIRDPICLECEVAVLKGAIRQYVYWLHRPCAGENGPAIHENTAAALSRLEQIAAEQDVTP